MIYENIARIIRATRKKRGLTQGDLANVLGCSRKHIGSIENKKATIDLIQWRQFCDSYDVAPSAYLTGYVDNGRTLNAHNICTERHIGEFKKLPYRYATGKSSMARLHVPFRELVGEDNFQAHCLSEKIDPDYLIYLDNPIAPLFNFKIFSELYSSGKLNLNPDFRIHAIGRPDMHGSLYSKFEAAPSVFGKVRSLIANVNRYEVNTTFMVTGEDKKGLTICAKDNIRLRDYGYGVTKEDENRVMRWKIKFIQEFCFAHGLECDVFHRKIKDDTTEITLWKN